MKVGVYSVFDKKAQAYLPPFFLPHDGQAVRAFSDIVMNKETSINSHPEDYSLNRLAMFDDNSGEFVSEAKPVFMNNAVEFIKDFHVVSSGGD